MISLIKQPSDISFSRNPLLWQFAVMDELGNPYESYNVRAELRGLFVAMAEDHTIEIQWTDATGVLNSIVFTLKDNPSGDSEIPTTSTAGYDNHGDVYIEWANKMNAHPDNDLLTFTRVFNQTSESLWVEAQDDSFDFSIKIITTLPTNTHTVTNDIAPTTSFPENHKVWIEIFFETANGLERVSRNEAYADANSIISFDIAEVIDAELENEQPELPIPDFNSSDIQLHDIVRQYYIRYREDYDGIESPEWTSSSTKYALFGGVAQDMFAELNFFDMLSEDHSLLTWYPTGKSVSLDQPEWVAWYNYFEGGKGVLVEVTWYDVDGNPTTDIKYTGNTVNCPANHVMLVPVGYTQLGIDESTAIRYSVRLMDRGEYEENPQTVYISEVREFYLDRGYHKEKNYLMYLNSFNCPETLRCVGDFSKSLDVKRKKSSKILAADFTAATPEVSQHNQSFNNGLTFRSGYLSKAEVDALQELLIYGQVWQVSEDNTFKLELMTSKFDLIETMKFLNSISFEARPALNPKSYSGILTIEGSGVVDDDEDRILDDQGSGILLGN